MRAAKRHRKHSFSLSDEDVEQGDAGGYEIAKEDGDCCNGYDSGGGNDGGGCDYGGGNDGGGCDSGCGGGGDDG